MKNRFDIAWISLAEELPPLGVEVAFTTAGAEGDEWVKGHRSKDRSKRGYYFYGDNLGWDGSGDKFEPTHWWPIPPALKPTE